MSVFGPPNVQRLQSRRDLKGLAKALRHRDDSVRRDAALALGHLGDPRAVDGLVLALGDPDEGVRDRAAQALGALGDPRATERLGAALDDPNHDVRLQAARALGAIRDPGATELLIDALGDGRQLVEVRVVAAEALGGAGEPNATEPLISALRAPMAVRLAAAKALDRFGWRPAMSAEAASYRIAKQQWDECVRLGPTVVDPLIHTLSDPEWEVRTGAAEALGRLGDTRAVDPLSEAYETAQRYRSHGVDSTTAVALRRAALESLGAIGDERGIELLVSALDGFDVQDRDAASGALERLGQQAIEPLATALHSPTLGLQARGKIALLLVANGMPLADERLQGTLALLGHQFCLSDFEEVGYDEDWKKRDSSRSFQAERDMVADLQERLVSLWVSDGSVDRLSDVDVDVPACESRLVESLESDLDWHTRGRVVVLLVRHGLSVDDPRLRPTIEEVQRWSQEPDEVEEVDAYWVKTDSHAPQRTAANGILVDLPDAPTRAPDARG